MNVAEESVQDLFAVLGLSRKVCIDLESLRETAQRQASYARQSAQHEDHSKEELINKAYAVLSDPKTRVAHYLKLRGFVTSFSSPSAHQASLGFEVGMLAKKMDEMLARRPAGDAGALEQTWWLREMAPLKEQAQALSDIISVEIERLVNELRDYDAAAKDNVSDWAQLGKWLESYSYYDKMAIILKERSLRIME